MSSVGRSIRFSLITALSGLFVGWRHARQHDDPRLQIRERGRTAPGGSQEPQEAPLEIQELHQVPPPPTRTAWFCDFESTMQSVQHAHYNGFISGIAWGLSHKESFEELRVEHSLTDERFVRMAIRFSERMTDHVAAASIAGGGDPADHPLPGSFNDLELE